MANRHHLHSYEKWIYVHDSIDRRLQQVYCGLGISNSLEASESLKVVQEAIKIHGKPEILNSDQCTQFSCHSYVEYLKKEDLKISMDGKGRCLDNIFIERFWRTLKYQHVFLNPAKDGLELYLGIQKWLKRYHNRGHQ